MKCRYCGYEGKMAEFVEPKIVRPEKPVGKKRYIKCPNCNKDLNTMSEEEITEEENKEKCKNKFEHAP